ncbi:pilus assembly protein PilB [Candidatus Marinimicrobia bacterium PRS2]|nr:pilus assembly protein PilB [Candidatus Marinimicrobia bacterium PRS2]
MPNFNPQFEKIGEILIHEGIIDQSQLSEALEDQKIKKGKIGHILLGKGYITENSLASAFSMQLGFKMISGEDMLNSDEDVVALLSEDFSKENLVVAVKKTDTTVILAMEDPENLEVIDTVKKMTNLKPEVHVASKSNIENALVNLYDRINKLGQIQDAISNISIVSGDEEDGDELDLATEKVSAEDAPFVKLVNLMLMEAIKEDSSDIHIEPGRVEVTVRIRIDGVLIKIMSPPMTSLNGIVTRIKILSKLNIAEHRLPQDGRMKIKTATREIDVRVSVLPTVHGEKVVLRLLGSGEKTLTLTNLGFPENKLKVFRNWISKPYGMVIISGPTGSGKSTTLYAALREIQSETINITTVEDPVEYQVPGINQVQIHETIGLNFSASLRSILRQDPDVLLIGEIRDEETANIAVKFSMTGHLVFTTVHANDAPSTIMRLLDLGIPPFLLGASLNLIMAQRLIRTIDPDHKEKYTPTDKELKRINFPRDKIKSTQFYTGIPDRSNHNTGYKGRTAIHEILEVDRHMKQLIFDNSNQNEIFEAARKNGMTPLRNAAIEKLIVGTTTVDEVIRATVED